MLTVRKRKGTWYARGTVPSRQASGEIVNVRVERSLKTVSRQDAIKKASDLDRYYWDLAHGKIANRGPTFSEAAILYIQTRGRSDRFVTKLIEHFKDTPLHDIDQKAALECCGALYPGCSNATLNRAVFTPLSAIGVKGLKRPTVAETELRIPTADWFDRVLLEAPPKLAALILFISATGRRVGEALTLTEADVDADGYANIGRTKNGDPVRCRIPGSVLDLLKLDYPPGYTGRRSRHLFGYSSLQGASAALKRVCERAGVEHFSFHPAGRHTFASTHIRNGKSLKWTQQAGGWKSMQSMFRYLHLERTEVEREKEQLGEEWAAKWASKK